METSDFATLLRRYRRRSRLTQEELAERAGLSPAAVSLLERGATRSPQRATVEMLAAALALAPEEAADFMAAARRARQPDAPSAASGAEPPPAELSAAGSLPVPLTALIGREFDEGTLSDLLARPTTRLLTLTGPAGVGKTRLGLQLAATLHAARGQDVVVVGLIPVREPERVLAAIAEALHVRDSGSMLLRDALIHALRDRRLVLVLDNFEQVLPAARAVLELLIACPRIQALVTSRSALNVRGEQRFPVAPLALPTTAEMESLDALRRVPTVALFAERAAAARPDFTIATLEEGRLVAGICARLDGLPLAIELAAARVRHMGLRQLHARLHAPEFLGVLAEGPQDLADHQRTMRSTVAWSYRLHALDERRVLRALGVFAGGTTENGVQMVAALDAETVTASLATLADANLVRRIDDPDGTRYDLFVIVRAFAVEQLRQAGELEASRRRLADYIAELVEQIDPAHVSVQTAQVNRLLREHDNLHAVLEWILESRELLRGQRLAARLRRLWEARGLVAEGAEWLERLLALTEEPRTAEELDAQIEAWKVLVVMQHRLSRFERAAEVAERVLALAREQGDPAKVARALHYLANPLAQLGERDRVEAMLNESLAINRAVGDKTAEMVTLINLGDHRTVQGRYEEALAFGQQALAISRSLADQEPSLALILSNLGETYIMMDRPKEARSVLLESQGVYEAYDQPVILALYHLGRAYWRLGAITEALASLERALRLSRQQDDVAALVQELCVVAAIALDRDDLASAREALDEAMAAQVRVSDPKVRWRVVERSAAYAYRRGGCETAARLYAAAEQARTLSHDLVDPAERDLRARDLGGLRAAVGDTALEAALAAGRALSLDDAITLAREALA